MYNISNTAFKGVDAFILETSTNDYKGQKTDRKDTFVLTYDYAKVVNKYDEVENALFKVFQPKMINNRFVSF